MQPAKLVQGLAKAVERLGVPIYEQTTVLSIEKGKVATDRGVVRAEKIVRATEGFTAGISGSERLWLPLNSAIVVTEPLSGQPSGSEIGWDGYEVVGDAAHAYCYAQRTREGRIAMGGRGVPYRFGSKTDARGVTQQATIDQLHTILTTLLPQTKGLRLDHAWCGTLGVPRDWCTTVGFDTADRDRMGRRLCRPRRLHVEPLGTHAARPDARPRYRADATALGQPNGHEMGAGAAAMARRPFHVPALSNRRRARSAGAWRVRRGLPLWPIASPDTELDRARDI